MFVSYSGVFIPIIIDTAKPSSWYGSHYILSPFTFRFDFVTVYVKSCMKKFVDTIACNKLALLMLLSYVLEYKLINLYGRHYYLYTDIFV